MIRKVALPAGGATLVLAGGQKPCSDYWAQKKGLRQVPTFVNLKSNTMKNTMQRYNHLGYFTRKQQKNGVKETLS